MSLNTNNYINDLLEDLFDLYDFTSFEANIIALLFRWYFPERENLIKEMMVSDFDRAIDPQMIEIQFPISQNLDSKSLNQPVYASVLQSGTEPLQAEVLYGYGWCYIRAYTADGSSLDSNEYTFDDVEYEFEYVREIAKRIIQTHSAHGFILEKSKQEFKQILEKVEIVLGDDACSFVEYNDESNALLIASIGKDDEDGCYARLFLDLKDELFYLDVIRTNLDEKCDQYFMLNELGKYEICGRYPDSRLVGEMRTILYTANYKSLGYSFLASEIKELRIGVDDTSTVFDWFFGKDDNVSRLSKSIE